MTSPYSVPAPKIRSDNGVKARGLGSFDNFPSFAKRSEVHSLKRSDDEQESSNIAAPVGTAPEVARSLTAMTKRADQYASFAKRLEAPPVANSEMVIGFRAVPIHSQAAPMIADQVHHQVVVPVVAHQPVADRRRYVHHA